VKRGVVGLGLALCLAGCGSVERHHFATGPVAAPTTDVLVTSDVPTRSFVEVGFVQAIAYGSEASPGAVTRALAREGGGMGCDAVVRARIDEAPAMLHAAGVCVRWVQLPQDAGPATR
jgi:hypothetical protein